MSSPYIVSSFFSLCFSFAKNNDDMTGLLPVGLVEYSQQSLVMAGVTCLFHRREGGR